MSMIDLEAEMAAAADRVRQRHLDRIIGMGVAPATIARLGLVCPAFGVVEAETERSGLYQPAPGRAYICQPVLDGETIVDLVIWHSARPDRWWLRTGHGWALNPSSLDPDGWSTQQPHLCSCPLEWLKGGANDAVILDWSANEVAALRGHEAISCADTATAATLNDALQRSGRFPTISVGEVRHAA